jgi:hypothetical protein
LPKMEKVPLLLPGQVSDVPADAVHGKETFSGVCVTDASDGTQEFASGEPQLGYEWVRHGISVLEQQSRVCCPASPNWLRGTNCSGVHSLKDVITREQILRQGVMEAACGA